MQNSSMSFFFINGLFGKLFTGSRSSGVPRRFIRNPDNRCLWSSVNMYLLLPIDASSTSTHEAFSIKWKAIRACIYAARLMMNSHLLGPQNPLIHGTTNSPVSITNSYEPKCKIPDIVHLADKSALLGDIEGTVVFAIHTGKLYVVLGVATGTSADSPFDDPLAGYMNFSDYFSKK